MAGGPGFEPGLTESESVVLPLDDPPLITRHGHDEDDEQNRLEIISSSIAWLS